MPLLYCFLMYCLLMLWSPSPNAGLSYLQLFCSQLTIQQASTLLTNQWNSANLAVQQHERSMLELLGLGYLSIYAVPLLPFRSRRSRFLLSTLVVFDDKPHLACIKAVTNNTG